MKVLTKVKVIGSGSQLYQSPDVISMSFVPIASLLNSVPGIGFLSHAINLYMRCKHPYSSSLGQSEDFIDTCGS